MKFKTFFALAAATALLLSGCSGGSNPSTPPPAESKTASAAPVADSTPAAGAKHSQEDPIVIASMRDVGRGTKDPYFTNLNLYVWEPLVGETDKGDVAPGLATDWSMSEDGKTWTFHLRKDVKFTDGEDFNADAVLKNFDRYKALGVASSTFFTFDINKSWPGLKEIQKVDDHTVTFTFENPMPTLPYAIVNWGSIMVSPACYDPATGEFKEYVIGTGPFKIQEHKKDEYLMLERNDAYWGEKAKTKFVKVRMIPDEETRVAALRSGEIQGVYDNKAIQPLAAKELEKTGNFDITSMLSANIHYLQVNNKKAPFNDVRMRQALSLAIDRNMLLNEIYGGYGKVSANCLSPLSVFYKDIPVIHDPAKAKELVKEVLGGAPLEVSLMAQSNYKTDSELIAAWLEELGLKVKIEILDYEAIKERRNSGNYDMCLSFRGMDNAEPETMLRSFMHSTGKDNTTYGIGFNDPKVDALLDQLHNTFVKEERIQLYNQLQEISVQELPIIPFFGVDTTVASSKEITGYNAKWTGVSLYDTHWTDVK